MQGEARELLDEHEIALRAQSYLPERGLATSGSLQPTSYEDVTLQAIAAAVVGGVAITGGRGSVPGVAIASLLLLPTFIVGVYGQNFDHLPELHWHYGYAFSWAVIVLTTVAQLVYFRRKKWV